MKCPKNPNHKKFKVKAVRETTQFLRINDHGFVDIEYENLSEGRYVEGELPRCLACGSEADLTGNPFEHKKETDGS